MTTRKKEEQNREIERAGSSTVVRQRGESETQTNARPDRDPDRDSVCVEPSGA